MDRFEKILIVLLRISGVVMLSAIVPAVMPFAWMDAIHRMLGMGELPNAPIVSYLTRSLSAMYALHGALLLFISGDIRRYLPAARFLAVMAFLFGGGMMVLDVSLGMPLQWTIGEGPFIVALGGALLWLSYRVPAANADRPS